jgi:hypothetical protein
MTNGYIFNNKNVSSQSIIHAINIISDKELIGAQVGIGRAQAFCTILQNCPKIKKIYAIEEYKPHMNYIQDPYNTLVPAETVDKKDVDFNKFTSKHNIKYSGHEKKVIFCEKNNRDASELVKDEELDFVFINSFLTKENLENILNIWYPKIKKNGIFIGTLYDIPVVKKIVDEFYEKNNVKNTLSIFDSTWVWRK